MQPLNVTMVLHQALPPKQIGTTCRGADFDGVPPEAPKPMEVL
jgi:hypothetical protein